MLQAIESRLTAEDQGAFPVLALALVTAVIIGFVVFSGSVAVRVGG